MLIFAIISFPQPEGDADDESRRERRKKKKSKEREELAALEAAVTGETDAVKESSDAGRASSTGPTADSSEGGTEEMDEKERKRLEKKKRKAEREAAAKAAMEAELAALAEAEAELARLEAESVSLKPTPAGDSAPAAPTETTTATEASSESATEKCESWSKVGSEVLPEISPITLETPSDLSQIQTPQQVQPANEEVAAAPEAEIEEQIPCKEEQPLEPVTAQPIENIEPCIESSDAPVQEITEIPEVKDSMEGLSCDPAPEAQESVEGPVIEDPPAPVVSETTEGPSVVDDFLEAKAEEMKEENEGVDLGVSEEVTQLG